MELTREMTFDLAVDQMAVALTVIDLEARIVFFNDFATRILDRKPEYIGMDIRECHKVQASNDKIDKILDSYKNGSTEQHTWQLPRDGNLFAVRVAPLIMDGKPQGLVHTVMLLGRVDEG